MGSHKAHRLFRKLQHRIFVDDSADFDLIDIHAKGNKNLLGKFLANLHDVFGEPLLTFFQKLVSRAR